MTDFSFDVSSIRALILDMDGVLWKGNQPIGDLPRIFAQISQLGCKVIFATNNATRTAREYVEVLAAFGVPAEPWQILTSATGVTHYLCRQFPHGGPVYIVGEKGVVEACAENGFYEADQDVLAVIAGFDRQLTYDKLRIATLLLHKGVPFIGTNPDVTFPTPEGLVPGAGSILAALTAASGVQPIIVGKPQPVIYQVALERLALSPSQVLVVGDRPETDIIGAQQIGCPTALVLSGVTDPAKAAQWKPAPNLIADDLSSVLQQLLPISKSTFS